VIQFLSILRTRRWWVLVHRCAGLFLAAFLIISGLTGAILAFKNEIDARLAPERVHVPARNVPMLDIFTLREKALSLVPNSSIRWVDLYQPDGKPAVFYLEPGVNGEEPPCKLLYLDPYTGEEVCRQQNENGWPLTRMNLIPFVFSLHETLLSGHLGTTFLGIVALVWVMDLIVGFFLTLPRPAAQQGGCPLRWVGRWIPSWQVAWSGKTYRFQFSLHRSLGLWLLPMLLIFAVSAVSFNLPQVYQPVIKILFGMPDVLGDLPDVPQGESHPTISWRDAALLGEKFAREQAAAKGWRTRKPDAPASLGYHPDKEVYSYECRGEKDVGKYMPTVTVYFDAKTGEFKGSTYASGWHPAVTFTSWIYAIHTRTIGGKAMQFLVCLVGLLIPVISFSGIYLWWRKRKTRLLLSQSQQPA